ncbi:hypothetical protein Tco_0736889 [Tanacetum coccineum]
MIPTTNTPYPSRKIRRIRARTHQRPRRKQAQYAVSRKDQYAVLKIAKSLKKVMANKGKKSSMETFVPNDKADYYSGITSITVNGKNSYELKGKFLDDLHNNAFSGTNGKDTVSDDESYDLEEYWSNTKETAKIFKIETDFFDYETPLCLAFNEFNYLLRVDPDLLTKDIMGFKTYEDYKDDWIYEWNENVPWDGYCNGGNLLGAYDIRNSLDYQDLEWYKALEDSELKDEALRNKAIMEGLINDDESSNDCWKRWKSHKIYYHNYDEGECENETHNKRHNDVDLGSEEISTNIGGEFTNLEDLEVLES